MSLRPFGSALGTAALVLAVPGVVAAQSGSTGLDPGAAIGIQLVVAFVINAVLGGLLVALAPDYARSMVEEIGDDPGGAFVWGLGVGIGLPIVLAILAITIIGLVVAIPGFFVLLAVGIVGNAVTVVWLGNAIAGDGPGATAVLVGALLLAVVGAIPLLGGLAASALGLFGTGVVGRHLYRSYRGDSRSQRRVAPSRL